MAVPDYPTDENEHCRRMLVEISASQLEACARVNEEQRRQMLAEIETARGRDPEIADQIEGLVAQLDAEQRLRTHAELESARLRYSETVNPVEAYLALLLARGIGEPSPSWALDAVQNHTRRAQTQDVVNLCHRLFVATANPMYAIHALDECLRHAETIPSWLREYLGRSATDYRARFHRFVRGEGENDPTRAFAEAFGIARAGGPTVWAKLVSEFLVNPGKSWVEVGLAIAEQVAAPSAKPPKESAIIAETAEKFDLSPTTAWRYWQTFKRLAPEFAETLGRDEAGRLRVKGEGPITTPEEV